MRITSRRKRGGGLIEDKKTNYMSNENKGCKCDQNLVVIIKRIAKFFKKSYNLH